MKIFWTLTSVHRCLILFEKILDSLSAIIFYFYYVNRTKLSRKLFLQKFPYSDCEEKRSLISKTKKSCKGIHHGG